MKIIDVTYDGSAILTVRGPKFTAADANEMFMWNFIGIPPDCYPGVWFEIVKDGNQSPFGPFVTLEQRPSFVIASGKNSQAVGIYKYTAFITRAVSESEDRAPPSPLAFTDGLSIGISPEVLVKLDSKSLKLVVVPKKVHIYTGMTVTWNFDDLLPLPEIWCPWIKFAGPLEKASTQPKNLYFGPFTCLSFSRSKVIGSGNQGVKGTYNYLAQQVAGVGGKILRLSSPDPGVDDEGDPPGGAGG
ncbi:MAG: hypothetical protein V3T83_20330 [Acidobacteriota bacterium]